MSGGSQSFELYGLVMIKVVSSRASYTMTMQMNGMMICAFSEKMENAENSPLKKSLDCLELLLR